MTGAIPNLHETEMSTKEGARGPLELRGCRVSLSRDKSFSFLLWGITPAIGAAFWKLNVLANEEDLAAIPKPVPACVAPAPRIARTKRRLHMTSRGCPRRTPGQPVSRSSVPAEPRR